MRASSLVFGLAALLAATRVLAADAPPATPPATPPAAGTAAPPGPSPDAIAEANRQMEQGRQALKAKHFMQAAQLFEAAASLGRQSSAHVQAGQAWEQADRPERAADAYARALSTPGEAPDATAKERLDALERSLGTLDVKAPAGFTVQLDSGTEASAPARLHSTAGIHSLAIFAPDRPIARRDVRLELGKPLALTLGKDEPVQNTSSGKEHPADTGGATAAAPQTRQIVVERQPPGQLRKAVGFTAIGLGAASLGATIVLGLSTIDARNAFNAAPTKPLYDHEQTLQTCTNVALVTGAVLAVGGVVLVLWPAGSSDASGQLTVGVAPTVGGGSVVGQF